MKLSIIFQIIIFLFLPFLSRSTGSIFNIANFGAKGDGVSDDIQAFDNCIKKALETKESTIIIPYGIYKLSRTLKVHFQNNTLNITGELNTKKQNPEIIINKPETVIWVQGGFSNISEGAIVIQNINVSGQNQPFSPKHPLINKQNWYAGIQIFDKRSVVIKNVEVRNIYGQGIHISDTKQEGIFLSARFQYVEIANCIIKNVWGFNPKSDNYGDGIYLSNVAKGKIINSIIENDFKKTKQFGRAGIVLEFMTENIQIQNNKIFGYDRGIHLEADYGNHTILKNSITGTDLGIVIYSPNIKGHNNPITIINNTISNKGLSKGDSLKKTYAMGKIGDRALLSFIAPDNSREGSKITDNKFNVDGNFDYYSNSIVNIRADNITITKNTYSITNEKLLMYPLGYFIYSNSIPEKEIFKGIRTIELQKRYISPNILQNFKKNNVIGVYTNIILK